MNTGTQIGDAFRFFEESDELARPVSGCHLHFYEDSFCAAVIFTRGFSTTNKTVFSVERADNILINEWEELGQLVGSSTSLAIWWPLSIVLVLMTEDNETGH